MTDEEVVLSVKGYMPGYELYLEGLQRECIFTNDGSPDLRRRKHVQVTLDRSRQTVSIKEL
jgi:D-glycerate 3-kinase